MSAPRLQDTVALVTGASSGIGEATARSLAAEGATVVAAARRRDRLDALVADIRADGGQAHAVEVDVTEQEAASVLVASTAAEHGRLDIVVNNAGVMLNGPTLDAPVEEWDRMVDLNVKGLLYVAKAAIPHLLAAAEDGPRQVADLVNISSVAGRVCRPGSAVYNLTKHGVVAFSEALRQEFTERHLRVSLVEPGAVATELVTHMRPEVQQGFKDRFGHVEQLHSEDIADTITFVVTRPRRMAINEVLVRPTEQAF